MLAVVGIVINRKKAVEKVNQILSQHGQMILGRMGIPNPQQNLALMALIIQGENEEIAGLTGKLGNIPGVKVRSAVTTEEKFTEG